MKCKFCLLDCGDELDYHAKCYEEVISYVPFVHTYTLDEEFVEDALTRSYITLSSLVDVFERLNLIEIYSNDVVIQIYYFFDTDRVYSHEELYYLFRNTAEHKRPITLEQCSIPGFEDVIEGIHWHIWNDGIYFLSYIRDEIDLDDTNTMLSDLYNVSKIVSTDSSGWDYRVGFIEFLQIMTGHLIGEHH